MEISLTYSMREPSKKTMTFLLFALVVIASLGVFVLFARFFGFGGGLDDSVTVPLSGPVTVGENGVVFTPRESLRISRASGKILIRSGGIRDADILHGTVLLADGSMRNVSVSLEDASGKEHVLVLTSVGSSIGFGFSESDLATMGKNMSFRSVRVRSDSPIPIDALEWYSWTGK